ncbi:adenylate cyclase type 10-like [Toxorhynchites rutilus septentrionalis]|uniref:adenylate cyclase type 10-like n=1 Tax=Toxorhynchites rutilus septentrionalis TaxID=329112 RepID=UPI002478D6D3|nr:adenylate cyclase type 10-like [Toxorhynchites rutilus septentrionalis]
MMEILPSSEADKGSSRLQQAIDKELFISRCKNRLTGKKKLQKYLPERSSFLYQFLGRHGGSLNLRTNIYKDFLGETDRSDELKNKVISSMIPDEVLCSAEDYCPRWYMTALMFADVSGFTDLSEKFNKPGKGGASKLSQVLNSYLGAMVQEILSHGGDILKFSGDAFLVQFKVTSSVSLSDATHRAIDTAIIIQKSFGVYKTEVGVTLRVKIAIAAGEVCFALIGTENFSHYVTIGQPVWKVKIAERIAEAGDIIVNYLAWNYIHENEYISESCDDKVHFRIKGFTSYWRSTQRLNIFDSLQDELMKSDSEILIGDDEMKWDSETLGIRPSLKHVGARTDSSALRRFMIKPILNAIDTKEPLEFLTEMRQIVTVFLNIVLKPKDVQAVVEEINSIFTSLCNLVEGYEGTVNKISLFDKDVMFLIIFGLRGYKHDLDSQIALRCAAEIRELYQSNSRVLSASIGVTTGMTYCGVVGHFVRREYSVISVTVNKAARLMMAYPNKVTCDKDTFMMSKLDPVHFTLQEAIELKGLQNVGPIYAFKEIIPEREMLKPVEYEYPLVGRDEILEVFQEMLEDGMFLTEQMETDGFSKIRGYTNQNCLLIRGDAQMGKTRLLNEIFHSSLKNKKISSLRLTLTMKDVKKPFSAANLYLSRPLGFTETITSITRENRIKQYLSEYKLNQHLSLLNEILEVEFPETEILRMMNKTEQKSMRRNLFELLCQKAFQNLWVLVIDDVEFMDDESLELFEILWKMPQVIAVLALGYQRRMALQRMKLFDNPHVCQLKLMPVDTLLHNAVACQFLNVNAIPLDLERAIHTMSNGNPGWINTFLMSLKQSGMMRIVRMGTFEAQRQGYVFCESSFLHQRGTRSSMSIRISINDWDLFEACCGDDQLLLYPQANISNKLVDVACLKGAIDTQNYFSSSCLDAFHLMLYDSLSSYEQYVCKCAAVLGQKFLRVALIFVISQDSERDLAIAIKKLFDLQILSCAIGDFTPGFSLYQKNVNTEQLPKRTCRCLNLTISRACRELPKYAACGYSKFDSSLFRQTVYNLLTEEQKTEFHSRALTFIELETKKCGSCGGGLFSNLISSDDRFEVLLGFKRGSDSNELSNYLLFQNETNETSMHSDHGGSTLLDCFPWRRSGRSDGRVRIMSYQEFDFTNCRCHMILYSMYAEIVFHSQGAGMTEKHIEAQIEWANCCIKITNIPKAIQMLESVLEQMTEIDRLENIASITYLKGRVYTLLAVCRLELGQYTLAIEYFYTASEVMGMPFPKSSTAATLMFVFLFGKVKRMVRRNELLSPKRPKSIWYALIVSQLSCCFGGMFYLFSKLTQWKLAQLAAVWSLKHALKYRRDSSMLVDAFARMFQIAFHMGFSDDILWMQERSLAIIADNVDLVDVDFMQSIIRYYTALLLCQTIRSKKHLSIELGKVVLKMTDTLQYNSGDWHIIPILAELLISHRKITEAITMLWNFKSLTNRYQDSFGKAWYYAIALDILLDTSCCIETYSSCESFYLKNCEALGHQRDAYAITRLYADMWLWCVRNEAWETADTWMNKLIDVFVLTPHDSMINVHTAIHVLEGFILTLVNKIEARSIPAIVRLQTEIDILCHNIEDALDISKCHEAKFNLMRIYYKHVIKPSPKSIRDLIKLHKKAIERNEFICAEKIQHTIHYWRCELPPRIETFWLDHCSEDNENVELNAETGIDEIIPAGYRYDYTSCILNNERIYPYSLPLPRARYF